MKIIKPILVVALILFASVLISVSTTLNVLGERPVPHVESWTIGNSPYYSWSGVIPYVWKPTWGEYSGKKVLGFACLQGASSPYLIKFMFATPLEAQIYEIVIGESDTKIPLEYFGPVSYYWNGIQGYKWTEGKTAPYPVTFVYAAYPDNGGTLHGTTRIEASLSPNPVFMGRPIMITGKLYGTLWTVNNGAVYPATLTVQPSWSAPSICNTGADGSFSISLVASVKGSQSILILFAGDGVLASSSKTLALTVVETIETSLTLSKAYTQYNMGLATKFYGYLREKETGKGVPDKIIRLTVAGRGGSTGMYYLTTNSQGYYEFIYANNSGSFEWAEARFKGDSLYLASYSGRC